MTQPAPRHYVVRRPSGDPDAARRLAAAYDVLADELDSQVRIAVAVLDALTPLWRGLGARAFERPEDVLRRDAVRVTAALRESADDLRAYAHRLARAHEHHGWSIGRLVAMGAMVTVGVAAVVVTVGAAAPAEATLAAAAVEGAEAATAAAGAASEGTASVLCSVEAVLAAVRPLAPFVLPHLVSAAGSVGFDAASELLATHRLDGHSLEVAAAVGFVGSGVGGALAARVSGGWASRATEAATWAAVGTTGDFVDEGRIDAADTTAYALTGTVARDVRAGVDEARLVWKLRVPQLPLGLDSKREWREFVTDLYGAVDRAGFPDATVVWRGSSITGFNYKHGHPFDALYRSDFDLGLVDKRAYVGARRLGVRGPFDEDRTFKLEKVRDLRWLGLLDITRHLSAEVGREVTWMVYKDLAAVDMRPDRYLVVPRP